MWTVRVLKNGMIYLVRTLLVKSSGPQGRRVRVPVSCLCKHVFVPLTWLIHTFIGLNQDKVLSFELYCFISFTALARSVSVSEAQSVGGLIARTQPQHAIKHVHKLSNGKKKQQKVNKILRRRLECSVCMWMQPCQSDQACSTRSR